MDIRLFFISTLTTATVFSCSSTKPIANNIDYFDQIQKSEVQTNKVTPNLPKVKLNLTPIENPTKVSANLNILTFNIWGVNLSKSFNKRMSEISNSINEFDFVNLQEVTSDDTKKLVEGANYEHKFRHEDKGKFKHSSGLASFSKYEIIEQKFMSFKTCSFWDCQNNKGVLLFRIKVPKIGEVDIYNTHYQSLESYYNDRLIANKDFLEFFNKNDKGNPAIITGDFNFLETSREYKDFMEKFKPVDSYRFFRQKEPGYTYDSARNDNSFFKRQRLDYVFLISGDNSDIETIDTDVIFDTRVNGVFLSDHFGLNSKVKITKTLK